MHCQVFSLEELYNVRILPGEDFNQHFGHRWYTVKPGTPDPMAYQYSIWFDQCVAATEDLVEHYGEADYLGPVVCNLGIPLNAAEAKALLEEITPYLPSTSFAKEPKGKLLPFCS